MKILFVGNNLCTGGVQTSLANILKETNELEEFKNIELGLFLFSTQSISYDIPTNVNVIKGNFLLENISIPFNELLKTKNFFKIFYRLFMIFLVRIVGYKKIYDFIFKTQQTLKEYDIAISYFNDVPNSQFNRGANHFVSDYVNARKKIAWVHTDPLISNFHPVETKKTYQGFDYIVNVSEASNKKFIDLIPEFTYKCRVVYNPFPISQIIEKSLVNNSFLKEEKKKILVTVARVDNSSKRIDRVITVSKKLLEEGITNFTWYVLGDGPDLKKLKKRVRTLSLNEHVIFYGEVKNPYPYMASADLFILPSKYEGYPMVVGESLILKTPVITTDYAAAHEQLINNGNSIIVENSSSSLFICLKNLLTEEEKILKLQSYFEGFSYSNEKFIQQYVNVLKNGVPND